MSEQNSRTSLLLGESGMERLSRAKVAIFGVGGVGGYICEALARAGVGKIDIFDKDTVSVSNINRQIIALHSTVGRAKVDVMRERIHDINPDCEVGAYEMFYLPANADSVDLSGYDYIADAVDTVSAKVELCVRAERAGVPIISAMGAGNKLCTDFTVSDIYKTEVCPLCRVMRRELRARGVKRLKVVSSKEEPKKSGVIDLESGKSVAGSISYVPSVMGLMMAGEIIKDIINK